MMLMVGNALMFGAVAGFSGLLGVVIALLALSGLNWAIEEFGWWTKRQKWIWKIVYWWKKTFGDKKAEGETNDPY